VDGASLEHCFEREPSPRDRSIGRILELCAVENWARHQS